MVYRYQPLYEDPEYYDEDDNFYEDDDIVSLDDIDPDSLSYDPFDTINS